MLYVIEGNTMNKYIKHVNDMQKAYFLQRERWEYSLIEKDIRYSKLMYNIYFPIHTITGINGTEWHTILVLRVNDNSINSCNVFYVCYDE